MFILYIEYDMHRLQSIIGEGSYLLLFLIVLGIGILYRFVNIFIQWNMRKRTYMLLSYIGISLGVFTVCFSILMTTGTLDKSTYAYLSLLLRALSIFGIVLILFSAGKRLFSHK